MPLSPELRRESDPPGAQAARFLGATAIVAGATLLRQIADPLIHDQIPYFIYVGSVVVATWFCGVAAGLFSTVLAAFAGNYLFVSPRYEVIPHKEDWIAMSLFAAVAGGLVWLVGRWRRAERVLQAQSQELQAQAATFQALHAEAERANRVKDEFLATLSHELRTPMSAVVGWAHLLRTRPMEPTRVAEAGATILRNAEAQVRLIDDLLDVSRIISGKLQLALGPVDLAGVVQAALDAVRPAAAAKEIDVRAFLEAGAVVTGDADRLRQVAWNLLSNAVKFTPGHGRVTVSIDRKDSQVRLTVSDTGVGIDPEFMPHLFERFTQADSSMTRHHGGLGLGLAIVRHIAELHGGTASADSPGRDRGASFTITLPVRAAVDPAPRPGSVRQAAEEPGAVLPPAVLSGLRVLVVDDEQDARELVRAVLSQYGAEVHVAASAQEAFQEVRYWRPDVLVADIGMPVEDGYSFLRRVRALSAEEGGAIPAAALTAYARRGDRDRALAAGFQEHVPKPVPPDALARAVARLAHRDAARFRN